MRRSRAAYTLWADRPHVVWRPMFLHPSLCGRFWADGRRQGRPSARPQVACRPLPWFPAPPARVITLCARSSQILVSKRPRAVRLGALAISCWQNRRHRARHHGDNCEQSMGRGDRGRQKDAKRRRAVSSPVIDARGSSAQEGDQRAQTLDPSEMSEERSAPGASRPNHTPLTASGCLTSSAAP